MSRTTPRWPHRHLARVPDEGTAREIATEIHDGATRYRDGRLDLSLVLDHARVQVRAADLEGRANAIFWPADNDRFHVLIDPGACGCEPAEVFLCETPRLVLGHELAHSFFFRRRAGEPPERATQPCWPNADPAEEAWCDRFAEILLDAALPAPWPERRRNRS